MEGNPSNNSGSEFINLIEEHDEVYDNIIKYQDTLVSNKEQLSELFDSKVVLAVGATGVGKSTLMNAII